MSGNENDFWMDDPEWAALREKQKHGQAKTKLSRAQRKQLREAQFQAELKAQQAKTAQAQAAKNAAPSVVTPQAQAYINTGRPSARYATRPSANVIPTATATPTPRLNPATPGTATGLDTKKVNVSVNLTLPHIDTHKAKQATRKVIHRITPTVIKKQFHKRSRKQLMIGAAAMAVLVIGALGVLTMTMSGSNKGKGADKGVLAEQTVKIDFKPLLPNGKTDQTTAHKAAQDGQGRPIYTFTDQIGTTDLTVSEQPLPESFKANTDSELEKMAKDLYLTEVINQSNPKAYMGTSIKGPQTVIFAKNGLLVFIQSQRKIDKDQWSDYVTRLVQ